MTSRTVLGWRVPRRVKESFVQYVEEKWGCTDSYVRFELELAMREYIDKDSILYEAESLLREFLQSQEVYSSSDPVSRRRPDHSDTIQLGYRVNENLKEKFKAFVNEHSDKNPGVLLAYAMERHSDGGRRQRILDKIHQLVTDGIAGDNKANSDENVENLETRSDTTRLSGENLAATDEKIEALSSGDRDHTDTTDGSDENTQINPRAVSEIASNLDDQFVVDDLQAEIAKTVDGETETIESYTEAVVAYENVVKHPLNDEVYISQEERDKITVYSDLDRDDRVKALQMLVARKALRKEKREWAVDYTDVQELFEEEFHGEPSDDYAYTLMEEASEVPWMQYRKRQSKLKLIIPDVLEVPKNILEDAADDPDVDINPRDLLANETEVNLQETQVNIGTERQECDLSSYSVSPAPAPKQEAGTDD